MTNLIRHVALIAPAVALLTACSGSSASVPTGPTATVTAVTVSIVERNPPFDPSHPGATFYDRGQTAQLLAVATLPNGTSETVTNVATWVSSDTRVATVSNTGVVTSVSAGAATISATYQGTSGSLRVTVTVPDN